MASYPLIDIYCHIYPEKFFEEMTKLSPQTQNLGKRLRTITKFVRPRRAVPRDGPVWRLPPDHFATQSAD